MSDIVYADMAYCSLCDRYFPGEDARAAHVQHAPNHPKCEECDKRFANLNSLRNHRVFSPRHHFCSVCDREFKTAGGLRVHIDYAAIHRDDSDDDDESDSDDEDIDSEVEGWEDELGARNYPELNEAIDAPASDDDDYHSSDDYWDEDYVEEDFEEEQESYNGFALAPDGPTARARRDSASTASEGSECDVGIVTSGPGEVERPDTPASHVLFTCPLCMEAPQESSATRCGLSSAQLASTSR